jgi:hypothetical protein
MLGNKQKINPMAANDYMFNKNDFQNLLEAMETNDGKSFVKLLNDNVTSKEHLTAISKYLSAQLHYHFSNYEIHDTDFLIDQDHVKGAKSQIDERGYKKALKERDNLIKEAAKEFNVQRKIVKKLGIDEEPLSKALMDQVAFRNIVAELRMLRDFPHRAPDVWEKFQDRLATVVPENKSKVSENKTSLWEKITSLFKNDFDRLPERFNPREYINKLREENAESPLLTYLTDGTREMMVTYHEGSGVDLSDPKDIDGMNFENRFGARVTLLDKNIREITIHNASHIRFENVGESIITIESNHHEQERSFRYDAIVGMSVIKEPMPERSFQEVAYLDKETFQKNLDGIQESFNKQVERIEDYVPLIFNCENKTFLFEHQRFPMETSKELNFEGLGLAIKIWENRDSRATVYDLSNVTKIKFGQESENGEKVVVFENEHLSQKASIKIEAMTDFYVWKSERLNEFFKGKEWVSEITTNPQQVDKSWNLKFEQQSNDLSMGNQKLDLQKDNSIKIPNQYGINISLFAKGSPEKPILNLNNISTIEWPSAENTKQGVGVNFISDVWSVNISIPADSISRIETHEIPNGPSSKFSEDLRPARREEEKAKAMIYKPEQGKENGINQEL